MGSVASQSGVQVSAALMESLALEELLERLTPQAVALLELLSVLPARLTAKLLAGAVTEVNRLRWVVCFEVDWCRYSCRLQYFALPDDA